MNEFADEHPSHPFNHDEVQALKALAAKPERRWWRDYPFLVSVLAFALSLFTSLISAYVAHSHDIHDEQAQLAAAIGKLQDLNLEQIELHEKYKGTPYEEQASRLVVNEANSVLHTAAQLGLQLGPKASSADLTAAGDGVYSLGEYRVTVQLFKYALAAAVSANDESIALRRLGFYMMRTDRGSDALKMGEGYFQRALELDRKYGLSDQPVVVAWLRSVAQLDWAGAAAISDCASAQRHFRDGVDILLTAPNSIDFDQARSSAKQQWTTGIGGVTSCPPDATTPALP